MDDDIAFIADINTIAKEALQELDQTEWVFLYLVHEHVLEHSSKKRLEKITEPLLLRYFYAVNGKIFDRFLEFLEQVLQRPPGPSGLRPNVL